MRFLYLFVLLAITLLACNPDQFQKEIPNDRPYYPSALLQDNRTLYVFSSNFDLRYEHGNALSLDLGVFEAALQKSTDGQPVTVGTEVVTSSGFIPSLADGAAFSPLKDQILYLSRAERTLRLLPLAGGKIVCVAGGGLGQDCTSAQASAELPQNNPYFLLLEPDPTAQKVGGGLIIYPVNALFFKPDNGGNYLMPQRFEIERFTWNSANLIAENRTLIPYGDAVNLRLDPSLKDQPSRSNLRVGDAKKVGDVLYTLFESPGSLLKARSIVLARTPLSALQGAQVDPAQISFYDLGVNTSVHSAGPIAVRQHNTEIHVYASNERPGVLLKLAFLDGPQGVDPANGQIKVSQKIETVVCDLVNDIKLSPDQQKLAVACNDGKLLIYDADTLEVLTIDPGAGAPFGRVPMQILFDERAAFQTSPFRFYVANFNDGSISVYDLFAAPDPVNSSLLKVRGRIFTASSPNRQGGA